MLKVNTLLLPIFIQKSSLNNIEKTLLKCHCLSEKKCLKKRLKCTLVHIILSSLFVRPNGLHVRSNLIPGLTYGRLIGKSHLQACIWFSCTPGKQYIFVLLFWRANGLIVR